MDRDAQQTLNEQLIQVLTGGMVWGPGQLNECVRNLLLDGADPEHRSGTLSSVMLQAVYHGDIDLFDTMVEFGGNPNQLIPVGKPKFHRVSLPAFQGDNPAFAEHLIEKHGISVLWVPQSPEIDSVEGNPLLSSVLRGDAAMFDTLARHVEDPCPIDDDNMTFFHYAALKDRPEMIERVYRHTPLDRRDALLNYRGGHAKRTPLHLASQENHHASVIKLLELKADHHIRDSSGRTPADLARHHDANLALEPLRALEQSEQMILSDPNLIMSKAGPSTL